MATSNVPVNQGTGLLVASYTFVEDGSSKNLQRVVLADSSGAEKTSFPDAKLAATFVTKTFSYLASTNGLIWNPTSGKRFVVCDVVLSAVSAGIINIYDSTTDARLGQLSLAANGGWISNYSKPYASSNTNNALSWQSGAGAQGWGTISGYEV